MQISLDIKDDVYKTLVDSDIDMHSKIEEFLQTLVEKKEFYENKTYFHKALEDIELGRTELLNQKEYENIMNDFEKTL